jgi:hypothetical protein
MALATSLDRLPLPPSSPAERMREAFELFEEGVAMKRQSLRRQFPAASEAELEAKLLDWLQRPEEP